MFFTCKMWKLYGLWNVRSFTSDGKSSGLYLRRISKENSRLRLLIFYIIVNALLRGVGKKQNRKTQSQKQTKKLNRNLRTASESSWDGLSSFSDAWSSVATSCDVGRGHGWDLALLCLWHGPAAAALTWPLARELAYATGVALRTKNLELPCQETEDACEDKFQQFKLAVLLHYSLVVFVIILGEIVILLFF